MIHYIAENSGCKQTDDPSGVPNVAQPLADCGQTALFLLRGRSGVGRYRRRQLRTLGLLRLSLCRNLRLRSRLRRPGRTGIRRRRGKAVRQVGIAVVIAVAAVIAVVAVRGRRVSRRLRHALPVVNVAVQTAAVKSVIILFHVLHLLFFFAIV